MDLARTLAVVVLVAFACPCWAQVEDSSESQRDAEKYFELNVRPILVRSCVKCHGAEKQEGGLRLDSLEAMTTGGDSGTAMIPHDTESSLILAAVRYEDYEMPPSGQLPQEEIEKLETWVKTGAAWPPGDSVGGMELRSHSEITDEDREYWAFKPLGRFTPPEIADELAGRIRTPIDNFVLAELSAQDMTLADEADRRTLARRLYFDLVGVPPTIEELEQFLSNDSDRAYEELVDHLLADPRYGEKWARHWLDLVRYAESDGFNQDAERPNAFLYRDWVINALNEDMPYRDFVLAQLAGDEVDGNSPEMLAATGYLRHWIYEYNQRDAETQWTNILNDITDVTGEVFFGLGIGCARCHDHKFDPLLQKDYYRLQASFAAVLPKDSSLNANPSELERYEHQLSLWRTATAEIRRELHSIEQPLRDKAEQHALEMFPLAIHPILFKPQEDRTGYEHQIADLAHRQVIFEWDRLDYAKKLSEETKARWERLHSELAAFDELKPVKPINIMAVGETSGQTPVIRIPKQEEPITPAKFEVFRADLLLGDSEGLGSKTTGRRSQLADWICSEENALSQRVIVNRIWHYHFGTGLVKNTNDFGRLGTPPSHPALLDWLARWFFESGMQMKPLHRLIVNSAVYRQSSQVDSEALLQNLETDHSNRLLWRFPARRLQAEQIRDALLVASGQLDQRMGGPSTEHDSFRRSIYTKVKRNTPHPFLSGFDAPDPSTSVGSRNVTTTPNQSLLLSNAEWPIHLATTFAHELIDSFSTSESQIATAYQRCFQRLPTDEEMKMSRDFLRTATLEPVSLSAIGSANTNSADPSEHASPSTRWHNSKQYKAALADLCHVLFNSSEFLYVE